MDSPLAARASDVMPRKKNSITQVAPAAAASLEAKAEAEVAGEEQEMP